MLGNHQKEKSVLNFRSFTIIVFIPEEVEHEDPEALDKKERKRKKKEGKEKKKKKKKKHHDGYVSKCN